MRTVDREKKEVLLVEMTCTWIGNRGKKETEKTTKVHLLDDKWNRDTRGTWLNRLTS